MQENASAAALRKPALDNLGAALKELLLVELLQAGEDAAEAVTRIFAGGGKLKFEIELSSAGLTLLCSAQRGDHPSAEVFRIEAVTTVPSGPKDN